jgi:hypothetical protein
MSNVGFISFVVIILTTAGGFWLFNRGADSPRITEITANKSYSIFDPSQRGEGRHEPMAPDLIRITPGEKSESGEIDVKVEIFPAGIEGDIQVSCRTEGSAEMLPSKTAKATTFSSSDSNGQTYTVKLNPAKADGAAPAFVAEATLVENGRWMISRSFSIPLVEAPAKKAVSQPPTVTDDKGRTIRVYPGVQEK